MICKVAESDSLRSSFPTLIGGLYMQEELNPSEAGAVIEMVQAPKQTTPNFDGPALPKPESQKALGATNQQALTVVKPDPEPALVAAQPELAPAANKSTQAHEDLMTVLSENEVLPDLFINYVSANGVDRRHGADVSKLPPSISDWPEELCSKMIGDKAMIARVITKFGKK